MERFWSKVSKIESGCWLWKAAKDSQGYGHFWFNKRHCKAHRVSWELLNGPVGSDEIFVLHKCDTPSCVNPDHLFLGTNDDNILDHLLKGRSGKKLDEFKVRDIRKDTDSHMAISKKYGVTKTLIGHIKRRKIWTHIND